MAKVLIAGYYGFGNLGDDLLLKAIVQEIRQADPEGEITALSARPAETGRVFGVRAICRTDPLGLLRELRRCGLLLFGSRMPPPTAAWATICLCSHWPVGWESR